MSEVLQQQDYYFTPEEYLAAERIAETRHEYVAGKVHAMAGASWRHNVIATNLLRELGNQLRGKRCVPFGSDMRLRISDSAASFYYYPDVMVDCTGLEQNTVTDPTVIFEVSSPETERVDAGEKLVNYRKLPSLCVYVLVNQINPAVTVYRRAGDDWQMEFLGKIDALLELPEIECRIALTAMYERLGF